MHTATRYSLESSEVVMMGRQSGSWTATSYEGLPRDDLVAKIKPDTLDNSYCRSIYTPQRTYWIMFDSSAKNAMLKKWHKLKLGNDTTVINAQRHCSIW